MLAVAAGGMVGCTHEAPPNPAAEDGKKTPAVDFTDVTNRVGLDAFNHETGAFGKKWLPETMGPGVGFVDYNSDGWLDVVFVGGGVWPETDRIAPPALALYRNEGDGTFTNATEEAGLPTCELVLEILYPVICSALTGRISFHHGSRSL